MVTVSTELSSKIYEQNINKKHTNSNNVISQELSNLIYNSVSSILENDEYDLFSAKSKISYDKKISLVNKKIEKLIKKNIQLKSKLKKYIESTEKLKKENNRKLISIKEKLK